jgi:ribonuclease D
MVADLARQPRIAVDTEANSLHAFREQVCLIQFSTLKKDYLVDPLTLDDLTPLGEIFASPKIEKVFHAAEYDVIGLQRDFEFTFANIYDTMLAARTLGLKQVGLGNLLAEKFGVEVDKHFQKANWGQRPLPPTLIDYARLDTHYLLPLREVLEAELREKGRWELAHEDFARCCYIHNGNGQRPPRERWERIDGQQDLTPQQQTILNELCVSREKLAERLNRPLFKVMEDGLLLRIAQAEPISISELKPAGLSERQIERFGRTVIEAVQRGRNAPLVTPTEMEKPSEAALNRLHRLKYWRKKKAQQMGVESDVILPRSYLFTIAERNPRSAEALAGVLAETPWRLKNFGPEILKTLGVKGLTE